MRYEDTIHPNDLKKAQKAKIEPCNCDQSLQLIEVNKNLLKALKRIVNAYHADYIQCPKMDIKTAYESNSQANEQAYNAIKQAEDII